MVFAQVKAIAPPILVKGWLVESGGDRSFQLIKGWLVGVGGDRSLPPVKGWFVGGGGDRPTNRLEFQNTCQAEVTYVFPGT